VKKNICNLPSKLKEVVSQSPNKIIMQIKKADDYVKYTYKEFYDYVQSIAYSLSELGIKKGDRVAIVLENRPEWAFVYFGIVFIGAIAVPLDPQSSQDDLTYFLKDSESKAVFTSQQFLSLFNAEIQSLPFLQKIIVLDGNNGSQKVIPFTKFFSCPRVNLQIAEILPKDVASILYTSGTTGKPKGVMLTHENFYANFSSVDKLKSFSHKNNVLSILPLHHSFPFMVTLIIPLFSQGKITYLASLKREEILKCMRETGVTILVGVPQFFFLFYKSMLNEIKQIPFLLRMPLLGLLELLWILRKFTRINLSKLLLFKIHRQFGKKLKFFGCGGAKLNEKAEIFLNKVGFTVLQGYGLTETAPIVTFNPINKQKIDSVGKAIPDVNVRILAPDESGIGEVLINGSNVMRGYYKHEKETADVLKDGWFYSGDLGYLDKQGCLFLTGRKKELIILGSGKNISPEEVEDYYGQSAFIKELCVLAVSEGEEERLVAVVVPDFDYCRKVGELNVYEIIKWDLENRSKNYPSYRRIMGFVITKHELPRTRLGKLKRFTIKEEYLGELMGKGAKREVFVPTEEDLQILSSEVYKKVIAVVAEEGGLARPVQIDDHLEIDLRFDSLTRVELIAALEKTFGIKFSEAIMAKVFTVKELVVAVEKIVSESGSKVIAAKKVIIKKTLWADILKTDPAEDIVAKIDLVPGKIAKMSSSLVCGVLYGMFKLFFRLKVSGINNLPKDKPFILCPNHASYLDAFFIAASMPHWLQVRMFFLGFSVYFDVPIVRNLVKVGKIIPLDPAARLIDAMQACSYVLRNNRDICIFPEGGRSIDGEVKTFKKGVGILAKELNVSLVPVYISGSHEAWPRGTRFPKPHAVKIIFGQPYDPKELKKEGLKLGAKDDYEAIAFGIREKVVELGE
jgi:long-chain acyl-CoA synthetase